MNVAQQFFNLEVMLRVLPIVGRGLWMTLLICVAVIPLGLLGGLIMAAAMQSKSRILRFMLVILTDFFRALPPLFLLILLYAGLPFAGVRITPFACVCLAFFLNTSVYYGEVYRAGFESVGKGQWEAARSTGLSAVQTIVYIGSATGCKKRASRLGFEYGRGRKANVARQRSRVARIALLGGYGASIDL